MKWAEAKGEEGVRAYRREKNVLSIDGLPTHIGRSLLQGTDVEPPGVSS